MPRDVYEIRRLLRDGISQEVSARYFDAHELKRLVGAAVEGNATLYVGDSDQLETYEVRRIAREGKKNVVFRHSANDEEDEDNQSIRLPRLPKLPRLPRLGDEDEDEDEDKEDEED